MNNGQPAAYAVGMSRDPLSNCGEYLARYDVYLQYVDLPPSVGGSCTTVDGEPVALINLGKPVRERIRAAAHEILHIRRGDLARCRCVRRVERRRSCR